jgi:type II secretory pathway component PulK
VGELALVRGIDAAALARLRPHVTVAGEHAVNPNTASREVLLAVVQDAAAVDRLLAARLRGPITAEDVAALLADASPSVRLALTPRGQHYTVRAVGGVGAVRRAVEATLAAPPGVEAGVVAWRRVEPAS